MNYVNFWLIIVAIEWKKYINKGIIRREYEIIHYYRIIGIVLLIKNPKFYVINK